MIDCWINFKINMNLRWASRNRFLMSYRDINHWCKWTKKLSMLLQKGRIFVFSLNKKKISTFFPVFWNLYHSFAIYNFYFSHHKKCLFQRNLFQNYNFFLYYYNKLNYWGLISKSSNFVFQDNGEMLTC